METSLAALQDTDLFPAREFAFGGLWRDLSGGLPGGHPIFKVCIGVQTDKDC